MTTMEQMAIEVLKGDLEVARMLADCLLQDTVEFEDGSKAEKLHKPVMLKQVVDVQDLRVVVHVENEGDVEIDRPEIEMAVHRWITLGEPLILLNVARMDVYEMRGLTKNLQVKKLDVPEVERRLMRDLGSRGGIE
jgi:hypothetical protein